jgi:hypothetical protein
MKRSQTRGKSTTELLVSLVLDPAQDLSDVASSLLQLPLQAPARWPVILCPYDWVRSVGLRHDAGGIIMGIAVFRAVTQGRCTRIMGVPEVRRHFTD